MGNRGETTKSGDKPKRPNIMVILADDMGYSDIGPYGSEIDTPTLDRLAENGLRFTQFYNAARCVPTRASLLTGLYQHQASLGLMTGDSELPGYRGDLNKHSRTIAQVLGNAGYSTYMSGKWHVTHYKHGQADKQNWPLKRGFDRFFGTIIGAGSYYDPAGLAKGNTYISPEEAADAYTNDSFYYTDAISDFASRFIKQHDRKHTEDPFFMYVAYTAPHWPLHAPEETIEKYEGVYDMGWNQLRTKRFQRMKEMGILQEQWNLSKPDPKVPSWKEVENKSWQARRMAVYAAQIDRMDQGIGRIVDTLDRTGQLENTLLLFLADNGGCQETLGWIEWNDHREMDLKPLDPKAPQFDLYPKITRDGQPIQHGNVPEYDPGPPTTYQSYGRGWANASNTPFREYKHLTHEGGIATPLIAHWPSGIDRDGEIERQPGHIIDLMPTVVELADAEYPERINGTRIHSMQGVSLVPAFRGDDIQREQPLFFEHEGNRALRKGRWKIVAKGASGSWSLYDMKEDRTETNKLQEQSDTYTRRMHSMIETWNSMARELNVIPWPYKRLPPQWESDSTKSDEN